MAKSEAHIPVINWSANGGELTTTLNKRVKGFTGSEDIFYYILLMLRRVVGHLNETKARGRYLWFLHGLGYCVVSIISKRWL
jgi:hypothetical protein